jgi:hypothetical protein
MKNSERIGLIPTVPGRLEIRGSKMGLARRKSHTEARGPLNSDQQSTVLSVLIVFGERGLDLATLNSLIYTVRERHESFQSQSSLFVGGLG